MLRLLAEARSAVTAACSVMASYSSALSVSRHCGTQRGRPSDIARGLLQVRFARRASFGGQRAAVDDRLQDAGAGDRIQQPWHEKLIQGIAVGAIPAVRVICGNWWRWRRRRGRWECSGLPRRRGRRPLLDELRRQAERRSAGNVRSESSNCSASRTLGGWPVSGRRLPALSAAAAERPGLGERRFLLGDIGAGDGTQPLPGGAGYRALRVGGDDALGGIDLGAQRRFLDRGDDHVRGEDR